jgi:hypothetical protein
MERLVFILKPNLKITVFTRMQGDLNLRRTSPNKACLPKENVFIQIEDDPQNNMCC